MRSYIRIAAVLLVLGAQAWLLRSGMAQEGTPVLEEVAASTRQWTGIAISKSGRTFVSYPRWNKGLPHSVAELDAAGTPTPFPDREWNTWTGIEKPRKRFVAVQSIFIDSADHLWVLDSGNPEFNGLIPGAAKLVEVDLNGPRVLNTFVFPGTIALRDSYLNDVRVDAKTRTAFITDSGNGAIIIAYLSTQRYRRLLDNHPSAHAVKDLAITVAGSQWLREGVAPQVHADGLALDVNGGMLYFQALTGKQLYRISTLALRDPTLDDAAIAAQVEAVAEVGPSDGLFFGPDGNLYLSSIEQNAIRTLSPDGKLTTLIANDEISWPDSFSVDPEGRIYFTTSRIHEGKSPSTVYKIFRLVK